MCMTCIKEKTHENGTEILNQNRTHTLGWSESFCSKEMLLIIRIRMICHLYSLVLRPVVTDLARLSVKAHLS